MESRPVSPVEAGTGTRQRRIDLDLMRIIACFLVIFNHLEGYHLYMYAGRPLKTWVCMFLTMVTRINVPLFFMISGTLLLGGREESYSRILKKRISRIAAVLVLFTAVLYFIWMANTSSGFSLEVFFRAVLAEPYDCGGLAYWYLYCYLGFLLLLPVFRRIAKGMTKQDFILLLSVHFFFSSFLPALNLILGAQGIPWIGISTDFTESMAIANVKVLFYPLIGYYLDRHVPVEKIRAKHVLLLVLLTLGGIAASSACTYYEGTHWEKVFTQNYVQLFDYLTAITAFILVKTFCFRRNSFAARPRFSAAVTRISSLTFGIYLLDPVFKMAFYIGYEDALRSLPAMVRSLLWCLASMLAGGTVTYFLKKIPGLRKLL